MFELLLCCDIKDVKDERGGQQKKPDGLDSIKHVLLLYRNKEVIHAFLMILLERKAEAPADVSIFYVEKIMMFL